MDFELVHADAIEIIGGLMRRLKVPYALEDKVEKISIEQGRGFIPCDMEGIIQCAWMGTTNGTTLGNVPSVVFTENEVVVDEDTDYDWSFNSKMIVEYSNTNSVQLYPMRYSHDSMHMRFHCCDFDFDPSCSITYQIQNGTIFTNQEEGCVVMAYRAIPTDEDGFPMLPDADAWILACTYELAFHICLGLRSVNKIDDNFLDRMDNLRVKYIRQAANWVRAHPTKDQLEASTNEMTRFIKKRSHHDNFFSNFQAPEREYQFQR